MEHKIEIPYLGMSFDLNDLLYNDTVEDVMQAWDDYRDELSEEDVIGTFFGKFSEMWSKLQSKYGHLYGLWDDCVEPQIRKILGFAESDHINPDRHNIYFNCRHFQIED